MPVNAVIICLLLAGTPTPAEETGFGPLLQGDSFDGWHGDTDMWTMVDGVVSCGPESGMISTEREYGNFALRFEFRLTSGANNGVGIRAPHGSNPAYDGMEIQILDHAHEKYRALKPWQFHGSIYGVIPAKRAGLLPVGEWNTEEIVANGSHITVTVNDHVIVDADVEPSARYGTIDGMEHPGLLRDRGPISLLGHGDELDFRNIRIREFR
ncbi:MAG: DUF1080 domain-containing protein [Phycisphaerales bacterium]|nr:DUF1080 domain-containing protein [Phycisphaerales bacterium]